MFLVTLAQSHQYFNGFLVRGRIDHDLLKTTGQRAVFFNVFAVFIKRGRTDALDFSARQGWFQHVGCVNRTLGSTGPDQSMQLIDE